MRNTVNIDLPQDVLNIISINKDEINGKLKELLILELYREHKISAGKAAGILNRGNSKSTFNVKLNSKIQHKML